jgi:hypothetical protein
VLAIQRSYLSLWMGLDSSPMWYAWIADGLAAWLIASKVAALSGTTRRHFVRPIRLKDGSAVIHAGIASPPEVASVTCRNEKPDGQPCAAVSDVTLAGSMYRSQVGRAGQDFPPVDGALRKPGDALPEAAVSRIHPAYLCQRQIRKLSPYSLHIAFGLLSSEWTSPWPIGPGQGLYGHREGARQQARQLKSRKIWCIRERLWVQV